MNCRTLGIPWNDARGALKPIITTVYKVTATLTAADEAKIAGEQLLAQDGLVR
jgi:hypothetical protein